VSVHEPRHRRVAEAGFSPAASATGPPQWTDHPLLQLTGWSSSRSDSTHKARFGAHSAGADFTPRSPTTANERTCEGTFRSRRSALEEEQAWFLALHTSRNDGCMLPRPGRRDSRRGDNQRGRRRTRAWTAALVDRHQLSNAVTTRTTWTTRTQSSCSAWGKNARLRVGAARREVVTESSLRAVHNKH